jgi:hypothetical protein
VAPSINGYLTSINYKGDGLQALNMHRAQKSLYIAERKTHAQDERTVGQLPDGQHVKNWRPQILAFVDAEQGDNEWRASQVALLNVLSELRKGGGLTMVVSIRIGNVRKNNEDAESLEKVKNSLHDACTSRKLEAFITCLVSPSIKYGMISAVQCCGVGMLKPNTILLGFLSGTSQESCDRYVEIVSSIIALDKVVMIVKGLSNFPGTGRRDRQTGTIDVYWVMHDGGVLSLISHLLQQHHIWRKCRMRIFAVV